MSEALGRESRRVFVVGAGGLVGAAVERAVRRRGWRPVAASGVRWGSEHANGDLAVGLDRFWASAGDEAWHIVWCAGAGVTDTAGDDLVAELAVLQGFLDVVGSTVGDRSSRGSFMFCSSAGAVYGGAVGPPFDEFATPAPLGAYGEAKLSAEQAVVARASASDLRAVVARIANVYGPGQDLTKRQGLVSQLCFSALTRQPVPIYVAMDTLRDYVYVDDCAELLLDAADRAVEAPAGETTTKVVCSGRSLNIDGVLGEFSLIKVPRPLVVRASSPASGLQGRDLRLRSRHWTDTLPRTPMVVGIHRTFEHIRRQVTAPSICG